MCGLFGILCKSHKLRKGSFFYLSVLLIQHRLFGLVREQHRHHYRRCRHKETKDGPSCVRYFCIEIFGFGEWAVNKGSKPQAYLGECHTQYFTY